MEPTDWRIIFVHGIKPKPPRDIHAAQLWKALVAGVGRHDAALADELSAQQRAFELVYWADLLYHEQRDARHDDAALDAALGRTRPSDADRRALRALRLRLRRTVHRVADRYPVLIRWLADAQAAVDLAHARHYFHNRNGVAVRIRARLKAALATAWLHRQRVLLIGHSLGSVIAWDTLWELTHRESAGGRVSLLLTLGSPMGTQWVQRRLLGAQAEGAERYPWLIDHWVNLSAAGDMTAINPAVTGGFAAMPRLDLIREIEDRVGLTTWYREDGRLNVHKSHGYLMHPDVGGLIAEWVRRGVVSGDDPLTADTLVPAAGTSTLSK